MKTRLAKWGATIVALWVAAAVQGCGDDDASSATDMGAPDLGPPADPALGPPDEPDLGMEEPDAFDAGPALEMSETFGPCQEDWQCPGDGAVCRRGAAGWPEGFCTVPCVLSRPRASRARREIMFYPLALLQNVPAVPA